MSAHDRAEKPITEGSAVLEHYALISHARGRHGTEELSALLHRRRTVAQAQQQLIELVGDLLTEVAATGALRDDVPPDELASYCLHALSAAAELPSKTAVRRLVAVTLDGCRPQAYQSSHRGRTAAPRGAAPSNESR